MPKRGLFAKTGSTEGREEGEAVSVIASARALFAGSCLAVTATRVAGSSLGCSFFPCGVVCSGCSRFVLGAPLREVLELLARATWKGQSCVCHLSVPYFSDSERLCSFKVHCDWETEAL